MKIAVLHGQQNKGSTNHIVALLIQQLGVQKEDVKEFYFREQKHCVGCFNCILRGEQYCPHYDQISPVVKAIEEADVIIMASPCYCLSISGQLKSFLDHLAYRWVTHRPDQRMLSKIGVAVSTTAGAGAKNAVKFMAKNMFYWCVPKTYCLGFAVGASSWDTISKSKQEKIQKAVRRTADKIKKNKGKARVSIRMKMLFMMMRALQKGSCWSKADSTYWKEKGWTEKKRPWKKN